MKGGEIMKEATGEANMTVITIVLIGIIVAVVTPIVNNTMKQTKKRTECNNQGLCCKDSACATCVQCDTLQ